MGRGGKMKKKNKRLRGGKCSDGKEIGKSDKRSAKEEIWKE